jgi:hypothetical protein
MNRLFRVARLLFCISVTALWGTGCDNVVCQAPPSQIAVQIMDGALNGRVLATIRMETYINNAKCNGWANISKLYQNGEVVSRSPNWAYLIK